WRCSAGCILLLLAGSSFTRLRRRSLHDSFEVLPRLPRPLDCAGACVVLSCNASERLAQKKTFFVECSDFMADLRGLLFCEGTRVSAWRTSESFGKLLCSLGEYASYLVAHSSADSLE